MFKLDGKRANKAIGVNVGGGGGLRIAELSLPVLEKLTVQRINDARVVKLVGECGGKLVQRFEVGKGFAANQLRVQIRFAGKAIVRRAKRREDFFGVVAKETGEARGRVFAGVLGERLEHLVGESFTDESLALILDELDSEFDERLGGVGVGHCVHSDGRRMTDNEGRTTNFVLGLLSGQV